MPGNPPVVLIDGDDEALVSEALAGVVMELLGDADRSLALETYVGEEVDLAAVADACATPPMLSDRRVVVLREVGRWSTDEVAPLLSYLEAPLSTSTLVLGSGGGQTPTKLASSVKAIGRVVQTRVETRQADQWLKQRIGGSSLRLDSEAVAVVRRHLGEDLSRAVALLDLLVAAYGEGAELGVDEVAPYLGRAGSVAPWTFTDAIDGGDARLALDSMHRLLEAGARHPLVVLAVLHRHLQSLMKVDGPSITSEADAAAALGIAAGRSTFPARKARDAARRWGSASIAEGIGLVADAEVDLKGASGWPADTILEVLVARLCRLAAVSAGRRA